MSAKIERVVFCLTGSFCSIGACLGEMKKIAESGITVLPVMSDAVYSTDTRFFEAAELIKKVGEIAGGAIIKDVSAAEPLGPKNMADALVIAPCTSNTLGKIANGINDTAVTMAVKSVSRAAKPVIIAVSTNDGLSGSAVNLGTLLNRKNIFFVPFAQDDCEKKPRSLVARFELILPALEAALDGRQIQPILHKEYSESH